MVKQGIRATRVRVIFNDGLRRPSIRYRLTLPETRRQFLKRLWRNLNGKVYREDSRKLKKKCFRVDNTTAAFFEASGIFGKDKRKISQFISSAIMETIESRQITLIPTSNLPWNTTVYFTEEEYKEINNLLKQLKKAGLKSVTFSLLARSVVYLNTGLVSIQEE